MKRGFTLIELLAVIVILAIIAVIAVPIVINIIEDAKENSNKRSIDMYAKAIDNAVARYQLKEGKTPNNYEELKDYIEYNGSEVNCDDFRIYSDGTSYLNKCKVDGTYVEGYSKGNTIGPGTIAYDILSNYGGSEGIETLSTEWTEGEYGTATYLSMTKSTRYYWGTELNFNELNGKYKLGGTVVQATTDECRNGQKSDGTEISCLYTLNNSNTVEYETKTGYKVTSLTNSSKTDTSSTLYITVQKTGTSSNVFSRGTTSLDVGVYKAIDDLGDSYYFRGAPTNNYVQFGTYTEDTTLTVFDSNAYLEKTVEIKAGTPMYWRIVRINGDGSIRLIYDGTEKVANGVEHTTTIAMTAYNTNPENEKYVGYTYESTDAEGATIQADSTIKGIIDDWYEEHLETTYGSYIADGIFCNDRSGRKMEYEAYGEMYYDMYYEPYYRLSSNKTPVLTCTNKSDRYTMNDTVNGNGLLSNPIGLLTADEFLLAGNNYFYLYSGEPYWTLTPSTFLSNSHATVFIYQGNVMEFSVRESFPYGARPVINLKADVKFTGNGTIDSPYVIVTE